LDRKGKDSGSRRGSQNGGAKFKGGAEKGGSVRRTSTWKKRNKKICKEVPAQRGKILGRSEMKAGQKSSGEMLEKKGQINLYRTPMTESEQAEGLWKSRGGAQGEDTKIGSKRTLRTCFTSLGPVCGTPKFGFNAKKGALTFAKRGARATSQKTKRSGGGSISNNGKGKVKKTS